MRTWGDWLPIETAPDDELVLVADDGHVVAAEWESGWGITGTWVDGSRRQLLSFKPTHWMRLPKGPVG